MVAQSSTYMSMRGLMCELDLLVCLWLVRQPVFGGEWMSVISLMFSFFQCFVRISYSTSITIINSVGARLSPCLTPVV